MPIQPSRRQRNSGVAFLSTRVGPESAPSSSNRTVDVLALEWLRFTCDQPIAGRCKMPGCNATSSRRHGAHGYIPAFIVLALVTPLLPSAQAESSRAADIFEATLQEPNQKTLELSYQELRQVLAQQSAVVLDARPYREYAMGHIPGALNVAAKPGVPIAHMSQMSPRSAACSTMTKPPRWCSIVMAPSAVRASG